MNATIMNAALIATIGLSIVGCDELLSDPLGMGADAGDDQSLAFDAQIETTTKPDSEYWNGECPAQYLLNVASSSGAGAQYATPELSAACTGTTLQVHSNGIPQ
ncbi:MAG: hypothetical protein KC561_15580, partial [Myxococcales bacterium]|nr:hypothetical protein [Myxococcales bacterium]